MLKKEKKGKKGMTERFTILHSISNQRVHPFTSINLTVWPLREKKEKNHNKIKALINMKMK